MGESMTDYRKPSSELIFDLIEEANPGFRQSIGENGVAFGTPVTQSVPSGGIADTNILVRAKKASAAIGNRTLQYRRIDLTKLFRGMSILLDDYYPSTINNAELVAMLNKRFGMNLQESDFVTGGAFSSGTQYTRNIHANSLCFKGGVTFTWTRGKQDISGLITNPALNGRLWPSGNDFSAPRKPQGEFMVYSLDCSSQSAELNGWSSPANNGSGVAAFINWVNAQLGRNLFDPTQLSTSQGGVLGLARVRYTLPNVNLPEANSNKYNRAMVFTAAADSWFQGKIIFHYNT